MRLFMNLFEAFWRGHDWSSSNAFTELLPSRPRESCVSDAEPRAWQLIRYMSRYSFIEVERDNVYDPEKVLAAKL